MLLTFLAPPNAGDQPRGPERGASRFSFGAVARVGCSGLL